MIKNKLIYPLMMVLFVLVITSISAVPTLWPNKPLLTNSAKQICVQFKLLNGSNRIAEFEKIVELLFKKEKDITNTMYSIQYIKQDVEKLLGKPNEVLQNGNWVYYLNPNQKQCIATFNYNTLNTILFYKTFN